MTPAAKLYWSALLAFWLAGEWCLAYGHLALFAVCACAFGTLAAISLYILFYPVYVPPPAAPVESGRAFVDSEEFYPIA